MTKLSVVIPIYNEAKTVRTLLDRVLSQALPEQIERELVIVESNSTDGSREMVQTFVAEAQSLPHVSVKLILQEQPRGKGFAMREGLRAATGDVVLIQDGDLEYDTADYPSLLAPILNGQTNFVLGSRHLSAGSWKIRKFDESFFRSWALNLGGVLFHTFFNILYHQNLTDPTTMYKVFRRSAIENLVFESNRFDFDFELVAKLIRTGYQPFEVPISYRSRGFTEGKKVRVFRDPLTWLFAIVKFRFARIKKAPLVNTTELSAESKFLG